ncbi:MULTISPECIES: adenylate kinase [unclassified Dietzia]|uniref:adenylate kinase n=1 Tax=unclassified Dietzia TaxID=2617939 RepID=UPI000D218A68|nr:MULTISPECIES: adenylate kinase [unclassified Dietzia]AVZ40046.1 adenylate kinase [Dietzia sp. JS16-p6b]MBB1023536.1 adenylate kinase [Dietzia sp. DQ12-76]MBB1026814.1 adenylate kinase [Dietzia sp. DQ11-38-2]QGW25462.1 adenylate kinase [Dietzia sp. DQ12-45-1b]
MRLVLLGPPGAGKGTQAALLSEKLGVPHISTGDLFRANISQGTDLGMEAKSYIDAGNLVPADVTNRMVEARIAEPDATEGFLLDGYPRSVEQADALKEMLAAAGQELDAVIEFKVDEDTVVARMLARGREDDTEDVIRNRMAVYRSETAPLLEYYGADVTTVDAVGEVDEINARALAALDR